MYVSASQVVIGNNFKKLLENNVSQTAQLNNEAKPIWQPSCSSLESLLEAGKYKLNTPITILIGSDLTRFLILPPQQIVMKSHEKAAYAKAAFQEIYGNTATDWEIKYHNNAPDQPAIVAAIDKNLLTTINLIAQKKQLKLNSVKPYVMSAFNASAKHFQQSNTYLAIVESNRLTLIFISSGRYKQLRSHLITDNWISDNWQADFKKILLRESAINETPCRDVLVYSAMHKIQSFSIDGWTIKIIDESKIQPILSNNRFIQASA